MSEENESSAKEKIIKVIVNGQEKDVKGKTLSFERVVRLAFENPPHGPNVYFTITYRNGPEENPNGTMDKDDSVKIKDGMIFNVTAADKS